MFTWSFLGLNFVYFLYFIMLLSALCIISSNNPVYSILYLILVFIVSSFLFMLYDLHFLGLMLMIVYLGAVIVLFLFIVMLLNIKILEIRRSINFYPFFFLLVSFFVVFFFLGDSLPTKILFLENFSFFGHFSNFKLTNWSSIFLNKGSFSFFGNVLYNFFYVQFILSGLILFIGMVGAIVLTLSQLHVYKKQFSYKQLLRNHFTVYTFKF